MSPPFLCCLPFLLPQPPLQAPRRLAPTNQSRSNAKGLSFCCLQEQQLRQLRLQQQQPRQQPMQHPQLIESRGLQRPRPGQQPGGMDMVAPRGTRRSSDPHHRRHPAEGFGATESRVLSEKVGLQDANGVVLPQQPAQGGVRSGIQYARIPTLSGVALLTGRCLSCSSRSLQGHSQSALRYKRHRTDLIP